MRLNAHENACAVGRRSLNQSLSFSARLYESLSDIISGGLGTVIDERFDQFFKLFAIACFIHCVKGLFCRAVTDGDADSVCALSVEIGMYGILCFPMRT